MSNQITLETFTSTLFALLDETFEHVRGIYLDRGTSLFETLAGITAEEASRATSGKCATLAAQVNHVRFYLDVLERYMLKELTERVDWQQSWQTTSVTAEEWAAIQQRLKDSHARVLATMRSFDDWDDEHRLGGALAIVVHTAHHLGEIRQMLCAIK
jgi:hypothetical protein